MEGRGHGRSASGGNRPRLILFAALLLLMVMVVRQKHAVKPAVRSATTTGGGVSGDGCGSGALDFAYNAMARPDATAKEPPKRRKGFKAVANANAEKYDKMWTGGNHTYAQNSCWGCRFVADIVAKVQFDTVLDAGTGNGQIVRAMRRRGKAAWGVELSQAVLERDAADLLEAGLVEQGSLTNLPYQDNQFDLVFSADVLEHIMPDQADAVAAELVRVAKRHIIMSISLKSHENEGLHSLLRPRAWWEALFTKHGATPNRALVWAMQDKETGFKRDEGELSDCRQEGDAADGGQFEVCMLKQPWLVGAPGQELRARGRCILPATGELEPWMFAFSVS